MRGPLCLFQLKFQKGLFIWRCEGDKSISSLYYIDFGFHSQSSCCERVNYAESCVRLFSQAALRLTKMLSSTNRSSFISTQTRPFNHLNYSKNWNVLGETGWKHLGFKQQRDVCAECAWPSLRWELAVLPKPVQQEDGHTAHFLQQFSCCFLEQPAASCALCFGLQ